MYTYPEFMVSPNCSPNGPGITWVADAGGLPRCQLASMRGRAPLLAAEGRVGCSEALGASFIREDLNDCWLG